MIEQKYLSETLPTSIKQVLQEKTTKDIKNPCFPSCSVDPKCIWPKCQIIEHKEYL